MDDVMCVKRPKFESLDKILITLASILKMLERVSGFDVYLFLLKNIRIRYKLKFPVSMAIEQGLDKVFFGGLRFSIP